MKLVFATNNRHKVEEVSHILGSKFRILSLPDLNFTEEIPEDFSSLEENALFKARVVSKITGMTVFSDDTGLEIDALNGRPGVHSARFAGPSRDFEKNIDKVLLLMSGISDRKACFRTVIALIADHSEYLFEGRVDGSILDKRRGSNGFGYDPVFVPDGQKLTFAEMTLAQKNSISHRAVAFEKLRMFLAQYRPPDNKRDK